MQKKKRVCSRLLPALSPFHAVRERGIAPIKEHKTPMPARNGKQHVTHKRGSSSAAASPRRRTWLAPMCFTPANPRSGHRHHAGAAPPADAALLSRVQVPGLSQAWLLTVVFISLVPFLTLFSVGPMRQQTTFFKQNLDPSVCSVGARGAPGAMTHRRGMRAAKTRRESERKREGKRKRGSGCAGAGGREANLHHVKQDGISRRCHRD